MTEQHPRGIAHAHQLVHRTRASAVLSYGLEAPWRNLFDQRADHAGPAGLSLATPRKWRISLLLAAIVPACPGATGYLLIGPGGAGWNSASYALHKLAGRGYLAIAAPFSGR